MKSSKERYLSVVHSIFLCHLPLQRMINVFKFGGASIKDAQCIRNMADIIKQHNQEKLVLIISALGKTTNALEKVAQAFNENNSTHAQELFALIEAEHNALSQELMPAALSAKCVDALQNIYAEADWILNGNLGRHPNYYYDQIVCLGEMMSTTIISHYFNSIDLHNVWQDVRDIIQTDETWREGKVNWEATQDNITKTILPQFEQKNIIISQGFIGSTTDCESTTLGREGSDYTAAIFTNMLDAKSLTIWKDVPGLLSGDPKIFTDVTEIKEISYYEVIEMSYYGAQVIHPKTIKPLQNKQIPLYVKCFLDTKIPGTIIKHNVAAKTYPPILVQKKNQVLLEVYSKDLSFITDDKLSYIYETFHGLNIKINVMQTAAVMFLACVDDDSEKLEKLSSSLDTEFRIERTNNIELLTIRHHNPQIIEKLSAGKKIILQQKGEHTLRMLLCD
jgi:aspartate kinase